MFKMRITILLIVLFIGGIMVTISSVSDIIKMSGIVPDFNFESMADMKKGDIVHGDLVYVFDCYAGETTTNTTMGIKTSSYTSREYFVMPLINDKDYENDLYISISASKEADRNMLNDLSDRTYEYLFSEEDVEFPEDTYLVLKAQKLDPELMGYMVEWFREMEWFDEGENIESHIIPYDLVIYNPNGAHTGLVFGLIMLAIPIAVSVIMLHQMRLRRDLLGEQNFSGNPGMADSGSSMDSINSDAGGFSESSFSSENSGTSPVNGSGTGSMTASSADSTMKPVGNSAPSPYIPQPVDPENFFAKPERNSKPVVKEPPKPAAPVKNAEPVNYSDGIDTSALDTDKALQEQEQSVSANYNPVNDTSSYIDTESLDTEKALYEQEKAVSSNYDPINDNSGIETESLDTEKALYEQEQAVAANRRILENDDGIDTDSLDTEKALYEQEQSVSSNYSPMNDNSGIDTDGLDLEDLGYFDKSASSDDDEDIFDFSNDGDFGEIDVSQIKISE